jgi:hypothetical protein
MSSYSSGGQGRVAPAESIAFGRSIAGNRSDGRSAVAVAVSIDPVDFALQQRMKGSY